MAAIVQSPGAYDMAYGPNIYTTTGISGDVRFVLEIWDNPPGITGSNLIAQLKQSPNSNDRAIFDVQNVLQSFVEVGNNDIDELTARPEISEPLWNSELETGKYYVRFGTESAAGAITYDGSVGPKLVLGGTKPYFDRDWSWGFYMPKCSGDPEALYNCTQVNIDNGSLIIPASPLSDWYWYRNEDTQDYNDLLRRVGGVPSVIQNLHYGGYINVEEVSSEDYRTKAYLNGMQYGTNAPDSEVKGIEGFRYIFYNDSTVVHDMVIPNIDNNGGGPNVNPGDGSVVDYPNRVIQVGIGPRNLRSFTYYTDQTTTATFSIDTDAAFWTHYYVWPVAWTPTSCLATHTNFTDEPLHTPQCYIKKQADCLDYGKDAGQQAGIGTNEDNFIQVSWLNSFGFRDYWTFRKKRERRVNTTRNIYTQQTYDPNASIWESDPANRGDRVYSQEIVEEWTATTGYMTDSQAKFLQHLFTSPDVRVKLPQQWYDKLGISYEPFMSAVITSNTYTEKSYRKDRLFQYEITFRLANNMKSQRG